MSIIRVHNRVCDDSKVNDILDVVNSVPNIFYEIIFNYYRIIFDVFRYHVHFTFNKNFNTINSVKVEINYMNVIVINNNNQKDATDLANHHHQNLYTEILYLKFLNYYYNTKYVIIKTNNTKSKKFTNL